MVLFSEIVSANSWITVKRFYISIILFELKVFIYLFYHFRVVTTIIQLQIILHL